MTICERRETADEADAKQSLLDVARTQGTGIVGGLLLLLLLLRDGFGVRHHRRFALEHLGRHVIDLRTDTSGAQRGDDSGAGAGRSNSSDLRERRLYRPLDAQHFAEGVLVAMGHLELVPSLPIPWVTARVGELAPCEDGGRVSQTKLQKDGASSP